MSTGGGPGAAWGRMGVTVPADTGGGAFKNAGNMARCPVTGIMWQRMGGLGAGTETRGGVLPGKSFSQFFGEQGGTATGRPACWPWWGGPGSPGFLERGGQGPEFKVREASPRCASRKAPPCPRSGAAPPLWSGVGVAGMWPVAGLPRAWWVAPATRALQGAPDDGSGSSGFKPGRLHSSLGLRAPAALASGAWEGTGVPVSGSVRSGLRGGVMHSDDKAGKSFGSSGAASSTGRGVVTSPESDTGVRGLIFHGSPGWDL